MTPTNDSTLEPMARLRHQWRTASFAAGWSFPDDWDSPGVPAMVQALLAGLNCESEARTLGSQRAERGVGLGEGLTDLATLFRIGAESDPPFGVTGSFAEGWSDATLGALLGRSATDPLTGFGTIDYLSHRLRELEPPSAASTRAREGAPYRLLLVRPADESGWERVVQRSAIARIMDDVLAAGETRAALPSGTLVGVVAATNADEHAARLRHRLARLADAGYVTIEVRPVPRAADLAELAHPSV